MLCSSRLRMLGLNPALWYLIQISVSLGMDVLYGLDYTKVLVFRTIGQQLNIERQTNILLIKLNTSFDNITANFCSKEESSIIAFF